MSVMQRVSLVTQEADGRYRARLSGGDGVLHTLGLYGTEQEAREAVAEQDQATEYVPPPVTFPNGG